MIVVTGGTGNVGRPLVRALVVAGARVRVVSRRTTDDVPAEHRVADLADAETLRPVLDGAEALFLLVSGAGAHVRPDEVLDVAKAGGVRRIVLLSSQAAGTRPDAVSHAPLRTLEEAVRGTDLEWTVLRPGGFQSNALAWAGSVRAERTVTAPFGDVGLPLVHPADIAEVAATALLDPRHHGRTYQVTGPARITPREQAAAIGAALGEPVRFVEQTPAEARAAMLAFMPDPVVDGTLAILGQPTPVEQQVSPDVEQVLGRAARGFADWAGGAIAAFR
jgi:uncharacterized protein YbjT (DUF2867 family)